MALLFDGINDKVDHGAMTQVDGVVNLSWCLWIKFASTAAGGVLGKTGWQWYFLSANQLRLTDTVAYNSYITSVFTNDVWYHLGVVYDGNLSGNLKLTAYLNSAVGPWSGANAFTAQDGTIPATWPASGGNFIVGLSNGLFGNVHIAHLRVFNNVSLTSSEMQQEMWSYRPVKKQNLRLWSPYDDGVAAQDYSGNGHHGTVTEATQVTGPPGVSYGNAVLSASRSRRSRRTNEDPIRRLGPQVPLLQRGV